MLQFMELNSSLNVGAGGNNITRYNNVTSTYANGLPQLKQEKNSASQTLQEIVKYLKFCTSNEPVLDKDNPWSDFRFAHEAKHPNEQRGHNSQC